MIDFAQNLVFLDKSFQVWYFELMNSFDGYSLPGQAVLSTVNNTEASRSYLSLEKVFVLDITLSSAHE